MSKPLHRQLAEQDPSLEPIVTHDEGGQLGETASRALKYVTLGASLVGAVLIALSFAVGWVLIVAAVVVRLLLRWLDPSTVIPKGGED